MAFDLRTIAVFLEKQGQLFLEPVAHDEKEAAEVLEDIDAQVFDDVSDLLDYMDKMGFDVTELDEETATQQAEVFAIGDGRFLFVEG